MLQVISKETFLIVLCGLRRNQAKTSQCNILDVIKTNNDKQKLLIEKN